MIKEELQGKLEMKLSALLDGGSIDNPDVEEIKELMDDLVILDDTDTVGIDVLDTRLRSVSSNI